MPHIQIYKGAPRFFPVTTDFSFLGTTVIDITELVASIKAGKKYKFTLSIVFTGLDSNGLTIYAVCPLGTTLVFGPAELSLRGQANSQPYQFTQGQPTEPSLLILHGVISSIPTDGNLQIRTSFINNDDFGTPDIIKVGSYLEITELVQGT